MAASGINKRGLDSLIILGHGQSGITATIVFDGINPKMAEALILLGKECRLWMLAGVCKGCPT
jgi:hypothetical protein